MAEGMALDKKIGPLPLGVWLIVVAGGLGLGFYINSRSGGASAEEPGEEQQGDSGVGRGGAWVPIAPAPAPPSDEVPETNVEWGKRVLNWLIGMKYDPGIADNAVRKYLYGEKLDLAEQAMINAALVKFGAPPEPIAPVEVPQPGKQPPSTPQNLVVTGKAPTGDSISFAWSPTSGASGYRMRAVGTEKWWESTGSTMFYGGLRGGTEYRFELIAYNDMGQSPPASITTSTTSTGAAPKPPTPAPPSGPRTHTIRNGDTLWAIALQYYGNANRHQEIYRANSAVIEAAARTHGRSTSQNGHWIYPGTVITIP